METNNPFTDTTTPHKQLELEYTETNSNFRMLTDIRFKLLAFLPLLGGVAVFALSMMGLSAQSTQIYVSNAMLWTVLLTATFGLVASLAVTIYDQRNSELYNALIHRARYLEELFESKNSPGALRKRNHGGQFQERPLRERYLFRKIQVGHDLALSLIYGTVLGAWFFPISLSILRLIGLPNNFSFPIAAGIAIVIAYIFVKQLVKQDREDLHRWHIAGERDKLTEDVQ